MSGPLLQNEQDVTNVSQAFKQYPIIVITWDSLHKALLLAGMNNVHAIYTICYLPLLYSVEGHLVEVNVTQDHPVFGECQNYLNEW